MTQIVDLARYTRDWTRDSDINLIGARPHETRPTPSLFPPILDDATDNPVSVLFDFQDRTHEVWAQSPPGMPFLPPSP